ncbi:MAG: hypothetical protein KDJ52_11665 [Anaerolineae bacterium]|nr:hypothetical protein [Anaerolineae bacterium]
MSRKVTFSKRPVGCLSIIFIIGLLTLIVSDGIFIIEPTELGAIRRFGQVISPRPLQPGLHYKIPLIDQADTLQVSLDTFHAENLLVYTVDNQPVEVSVSMSYRIPEHAVFNLMYQVGRAGSVDIAENIRPVLNDRIMRVFAKMNTTKISEDRVVIAEEIKRSAQEVLNDLFALEVVDLQISSIKYSQVFEASIEAAVKAKNDATAAENTVKRVQYEGEQKVVKAEADAKALIAEAEAKKQAKILEAEGEARLIELEGKAKADALKLQAAAIRDNPELIDFTQAQNWDGKLPQTILGNAMPFLDVGGLMAEPTQ